MPDKSTLKIRVTHDPKKGRHVAVLFVNKNGGHTPRTVAQGIASFDLNEAQDGMEVDVEHDSSQKPLRVSLPGQPATAAPAAAAAAANVGGPVQVRGGQITNGGNGRGHGATGAPAPQPPAPNGTLPARRDGRAPYNFVPVEKGRIALGFAPPAKEQSFTGRLACSLTALTPLLVAGPQDREDSAKPRTFFKIGGRNVIPGTSLKGPIRSMLEALSFSRLWPVALERLFYRDINSAEYKQLFRAGQGLTAAKAGFYDQRENVLYPAEAVRVRHASIKDLVGVGVADASAAEKTRAWYNARKSFSVAFRERDQAGTDPWAEADVAGQGGPDCCEGQIVFTGPMSKKSHEYVFFNGDFQSPDEVPEQVRANFRDQLTKDQQDLLRAYDAAGRKLTPVFYLVNDNGSPSAIGLSRLFRVALPKCPADLSKELCSGGAPSELDFCQLLFGHIALVEHGPSLRGRVRVSSATCTIEGRATKRFGPLVPGQPSATCAALYLRQPADRAFAAENSEHRGNAAYVKNTVLGYHSNGISLRGRKLYWHRDPTVSPPAGDNLEVRATYLPVVGDSRFMFSVDFDALSAAELGGLLCALDLPSGHAHKLGLGKSFGLGSVRIGVDYDKSRVYPSRPFYCGLAARLGGEPRNVDLAGEAAAFRRAFREEIACKIGFAEGEFENQAEIRALRAMTDNDHRPAAAQTAFMPLELDEAGGPSYAVKSILPDALEVAGIRAENRGQP